MSTSDNNDSPLMYEAPAMTELQYCQARIVAGATEMDLDAEKTSGQGYGVDE